MENSLTLPYAFDTIKYMRLGVYAILLCMLAPVAEVIYLTFTADSFVLTTLLSGLVHGSVGLLICAFAVHYLLKYMNPVRGELSRHQVRLESFSPFGLGHAVQSGTYPMSAFSTLRLRRVEPRNKRTIGTPRAVYLLQLEWADASNRALSLLVSDKHDTPELAKQLANSIGLPLEAQ